MPELIIENIHETYNFKLLKEVYYQILLPCFPDPEDHLDWRTMKKMVKRSFKDPSCNEKILISVSCQIMPDGEKKPVSFFVGIYYRRSATGLISYMGMRDGCRGLSASNIQKQVLIEMEKTATLYHSHLRAVFSLVDLPEKADSRYITLPPVQRIRIMERNGARYIPIDFYYPAFDKGVIFPIKKRVSYKDDAALLGYKLHGSIPTENPKDIENFIDDFYRSYGIDPAKDHVVEGMHHALKNMEKGVEIKLSKQYRKSDPSVLSCQTERRVSSCISA